MWYEHLVLHQQNTHFSPLCLLAGDDYRFEIVVASTTAGNFDSRSSFLCGSWNQPNPPTQTISFVCPNGTLGQFVMLRVRARWVSIAFICQVLRSDFLSNMLTVPTKLVQFWLQHTGFTRKYLSVCELQVYAGWLSAPTTVMLIMLNSERHC